jgi:3-dehydroquinate dehydratase I
MSIHTASQYASLLSRVLTVGSVADGATLDRLPGLDLPSLCDVLELRVDTWPARAEEAAVFSRTCPVPVLVTARCPEEGGQNALPTTERERLASLFLPGATLLDVEIASLAEMSRLVSQAKSGGTLVVASFHDFTATPSADELRRKRDAALTAGADIVKFATTLRSSADVAILAGLLEEPGHAPLSVMGMGPLGRGSRVLLAQLGSVLNYGYLDRATVPGQWPAARLRELIAEARG